MRLRNGVIALLALASACRAPASRAVDGPIAEQIQAAISGGKASFAHADWNALLAAAVHDGRVDYVLLATRREELDAYLGRIAAADLASLAPKHLEALLFNAYNALTIRSILDHPDVKSIREIDGVWKKTEHRVGGHQLTLDAIEHNLLRPFFRDPRIHFAVNCASASCAPLPPWAFDGDRLEEQLAERTRAFLRDPQQIRVEDDALHVSRYFDWYGDDFTAEGWSPRADSIAQFIAGYATEAVAAFIAAADGRPEIHHLDYDWSLNALATQSNEGDTK